MMSPGWKTAMVGGLASLAILPALTPAAVGASARDQSQIAKRSSSSNSDSSLATNTIEVQSFSWGASQPAAKGGSASVCQPPALPPPAARNQNASRTNSGGRSGVAAPPLATPPPPENAACVAVRLSKTAAQSCAKGGPKVIILMTDGMARYTLSDATVEACGEDSMVLSFKTVGRSAPPAPVQQVPAAHATISGSD